MVTPQEKWNRMTSPKCADDYGISISFEEMSTFSEGKAWADAFNPSKDVTAEAIAKNISDSRNAILLKSVSWVD